MPLWDFKDPALKVEPESVVKDSCAAAIVVEQLARLAVTPELDHVAREVVELYLGPMIDGLFKSLAPREGETDFHRVHCLMAVSTT